MLCVDMMLHSPSHACTACSACIEFPLHAQNQIAAGEKAVQLHADVQHMLKLKADRADEIQHQVEWPFVSTIGHTMLQLQDQGN